MEPWIRSRVHAMPYVIVVAVRSSGLDGMKEIGETYVRI